MLTAAILSVSIAMLLCGSHTHAQAPANPLAGYCVNKSAGKMFQNPTDTAEAGCETTYIICQGSIARVMPCAASTSFSPVTSSCVPTPATCRTTPKPPTPKTSAPTPKASTPVRTAAPAPADPAPTVAPEEAPVLPEPPAPAPVPEQSAPAVSAPAKPAPPTSTVTSTPSTVTSAPSTTTPPPSTVTRQAEAAPLIDLDASAPTGDVLPSNITTQESIAEFLQRMFARVPTEAALPRVTTITDVITAPAGAPILLPKEAPGPLTGPLVPAEGPSSSNDGSSNECDGMEFQFDVAGDVLKINLEDVVDAVDRVLGVKVQGVEQGLHVHTALVLYEFPVPVTEDNRREVSDIVRKLVAYSQEGLVEESDIAVVGVEDQFASLPDISVASLEDSSNATTCYNNTVIVDMELIPLTLGEVGVTDLMSGMEELPTRGLKRVVRRIADASQSGIKLSNVLKNYVLNMPGNLGGATVLSIRPSIMIPNDCSDAGPDALRGELVDAFANGDFVDVLDDGKKSLQATVGPYMLADLDNLRSEKLLLVNVTSSGSSIGSMPPVMTCPRADGNPASNVTRPGASVAGAPAPAPGPSQGPANAAAGLKLLPVSLTLTGAAALALLVAL